MSQPNDNQVSETPEPVAEDSFLDTGLSDADLAAMQGLEVPAEEPSDSPASIEDLAPEPDSEQDATEEAGDEPEDGEIVLDEQGRAKDAKTGRFVPHAALHKERERRKEIETAYKEELERRARLEGRIEEVNQRLAPKQETGEAPKSPLEEEPIDPEEDIFGAFQRQQRVIRAMQEQIMQTTQTQQSQVEEQTVQQQYVRDAVTFSKETPDFADAYKHIKQGFHAELELQGMTDPSQREQFIKQEEYNLVQNALRQGRSPSEIIYNMAKTRGYMPKSATQENPAQQKLENLKQAKAASNQVAQAAQGQASAGVTYETLADMTDDEMYDWASKNPDQFKKMFSGM